MDSLCSSVSTTCAERCFHVHNMWANYNGVTTRCSAIMRDCEVGRKPWARRLSAGHVCAGQSLFPTFRMGASACHRRVWTQLLVLLGRTRHHTWWCWHSWGHDPLGDAPADAGPSRRLCRSGQSEGEVRRGRFRGHRDDEGGGVGHAPTRHAPHVLTAVSHGAPDSRHAGHTSLHDHSRHARHPCPMAIAPAWDHSAPPLPRFALPGRSRALPTYAPGRHRDGRGSWFNSLMKALLPGRRHVARHTVGYVTNQHYAGRHRG